MLESFALPAFITALFLLIIISVVIRVAFEVLIPFKSVRWVFFFPGVLIHECAHIATARLLAVPVLETNFSRGYVLTDHEGQPTWKIFLIGITPLFFAFVIGGTLFIWQVALMASGQVVLGALVLIIGLSVFAHAAPSPQDVVTFLQNNENAVTEAVWILVCALIGFFLMLEQPLGMLEPFKQSHPEATAIAGAVVVGVLGALLYRLAVQHGDGGTEKWIL